MRIHGKTILTLFILIFQLVGCGGSGGSSVGGDDSTGTTSGIAEIGSLDPDFGKDNDGDGVRDGWIVHYASDPSTFGNTFRVRDAVLDGSGRIYFTGYFYDFNAARERMLLLRLVASGELDTTFGVDYNSDGVKDGYWLGPETETTVGNALTLNNSATAVYVTGYIENSAGFRDMQIWRFDAATGLPDTSFDSNIISSGDGAFEFSDPDSDGDGSSEGDAEGFDVFVGSSGEIFVAGYTTNDRFGSEVAIWRLVSVFGFWGLDTFYANNGVFTYDAGEDSNAVSLAQTSDGKLFVGVTADNRVSSNSLGDVIILRLDEQGQPDMDFPPTGAGGELVLHDIAGGGGGDVLTEIITLPDDTLLLVGYSANTTISTDGFVSKLTSSSGSWNFDTNFAENGTRLLHASNGTARSIFDMAYLPSENAILLVGKEGLFPEKLAIWKLDGQGDISNESYLQFSSNDFFAFQRVFQRASSQTVIVGERINTTSFGVFAAQLR